MSIKTNNIQELLKAKGISTTQKKHSVSEEYGQGIKRLYNVEPASPPPILTKTDGCEVNLHQCESESSPKLKEPQALNKVDTNPTQMVHKPYTNHTQMVHKPYTNPTQMVHKVDTNGTQTLHKVDTNPTQMVHKPYTTLSFSSLVGLQRKVLLFFFQDCKIRRSKTTQEITLQHIADNQNITFGSVKTTIIRLLKKGYVKRFQHKSGRGGWCSFEIPDLIYKEILLYEELQKVDTNGTQMVHKPYTQPYTNLLCSSSIINTTTTEDLKILIIPPELQAMGVSLKTLESYLGKITAQEIQQSIDE